MTGLVFISHSSRDKALAAELGESIRACGVDVWLDARELTAGDQLESEILSALEAARAVVVLLSPRTINSKWVTKEVRYALELRKQRGPEY